MKSEIVRTLGPDDLEKLSWAGGKRHQEYLVEWMERALAGEFLFLGLFEGEDIIGLGYVDFTIVPGVGTLYALSIREDKRSLGKGSVLIAAFENEVRERGMNAMELRVETKNERAITLYEKLGYISVGTSVESWEQYDNEGNIEMYTTDALVMRKELGV